MWVVSSLQRVFQKDAPGSSTKAQISAAKGEYEAYQIIVRAPSGGLTNVNVTVSNLTGPGGAVISAGNCTLYRENYVSIWPGSVNWNGSNQPLGPGVYPDGLIPFKDPVTGASLYNSSASLRAVPFNLSGSTNQPIWVDVQVPTTAVAGLYTGTYTVTSNQGSASGSVALTVWNFTLPTKPYLKSSFIYWTDGNLNTDKELVRHRVMPQSNVADQPTLMSLGLNVTSLGFYSGAKSGYCYMSAAPSVTQFQNAAAAQTPGLYIYDYSADEITNCTNLYTTVQQWACNMHKAGVNNLITMAPNPKLYTDGCTSRSAVDIWAVLPVTYNLSPSNVAYVISKGDEVWSYNTLVQDAYSPKWEIDFAPINFRIQPGFINQALNMTGLLYWRVDFWLNNPWTNIDNVGHFSTNDYPGDGTLVYPGAQVGITSVAPSIRLKWIRDGVDDYDYIQLLKNAGYGSWAVGLARTIAPDWTNWTRDINALQNVRTQLGQKLDQLHGGTSGTGTTTTTGSMSVSPASGSGSTQWFQLAYGASGGGTALGGGGVLFSSTTSGANACWIFYNRAANTFALAANSGTSWSTTAAGGTLSNSQCKINGGSAAILSNGMQVSVSITFSSTFGGTKNVYMYDSDNSGTATPYLHAGTWTVPGSTGPSPTQVSPSSGSGYTQWFQLSYSASGGGTSIGGGGVLFNTTTSGVNGCWVYYNRAANTFSLANDAGTGWSSMAAGGSSKLSNSHCTVDGGSAALFSTGMQVSVEITFSSAFAGTKNVYLYAADNTGKATPYQRLGTWSIP